MFASFNIRKFGALADGNGNLKRSDGAWDLLTAFCERCDLVAIQEVLDRLDSLRHLRDRLGSAYALVVSDIAGGLPGRKGNKERLAFLYNTRRLKRTELSSDIVFERTAVFDQLFEHWPDFEGAFESRRQALQAWQAKAESNRRQGKKPPRKPPFVLPHFVQFIRSPHLASFEVEGRGGAAPYEFICINAHLLYGDKHKQKDEREREFKALIGWLIDRARETDRNYVSNMILFGDLNLDFKRVDIRRSAIEKFIKSLNSDPAKLRNAAKVNFPFLDAHPSSASGRVFRTNARKDQTYDQIAIFAHDKRLPPPHRNTHAGKAGPNSYDYGMFDFVQLFLDAVPALTRPNGKIDYGPFEYDVSDHMPIWIRLPIPHTNQPTFRWR
ncbi:MAG: hypothetical protein ACR2PO_18365 [Methyloligellaceae bacterium]